MAICAFRRYGRADIHLNNIGQQWPITRNMDKIWLGLSRTVKALGYPNRALVFEWLKEDVDRATHPCRSGSAMVKLLQSKKEQTVIDLCVRDYSAKCIASKYGVSRESLDKWKNEMLGKECVPEMPEKSVTQPAGTEHTVEGLRSEAAIREKKVSDLQK